MRLLLMVEQLRSYIPLCSIDNTLGSNIEVSIPARIFNDCNPNILEATAMPYAVNVFK